MLQNLSITFIHFVKSMWELCECISDKMKSWIAESDIFHSPMLVCHDDNPQRLQALIAENQSVNAAPPPSKAEDFHSINTFFISLHKILTEIENGFGGNDREVLCGLGDITLSDSPTSESFDLVVRYYNLDKELIQADQRLFSQFKTVRFHQSNKKSYISH